AVRIERPERAAERIGRALVVGKPPRNGDAAGVAIDELRRRQVVEAVLGVRAPEPGLTASAPGRLRRRIRVGVVVVPDRAGPQETGDALGPVVVSRPDRCTEPEGAR